MKAVTLSRDDLLIIRFTYDPATVAQVRCLPPGRRWVPELKAWTCPLSLDAIGKLRRWGFDLDQKVLDAEAQLKGREWAPGQTRIASADIPGLNGNLYPFQEDGVGFIEDHGGRALVADEMGLGKTIQALAWLQLNQAKALPAVVVCPASLKGVWERECRKWTTLKPHQLQGLSADRSQLGGDVVIINYDVLIGWLPLLKGLPTVILDEVHYIKNRKAKRTKAAMTLCRQAKHLIALSGTPIVNRPIELFNTLNLLAPTQFNRYWDYAQRYCDAKHNGFGWDLSGASNTEELHAQLVRSVMIRRTKSEVLKDLPEKTRSVVPLELGLMEQASYDRALKEVAGAMSDKEPDPLADVTQISKLRRVVAAGKMEQVIEWIENTLANVDKLIVFTIHHSTADALFNRFIKCAIRLDGRTPTQQREGVVCQFQNNKGCRLLIGNVQVAGVGWTLTAAQDAAFVEFPWTPGELVQAEDRIHRIGQKGAANIHYLIAAGTLEEDIAELLDEKRKVLGAVLDGGYDESISIVKELAERIRKRGQ